ncbi:outer membrane protein assembly factor BamE [Pseudaeromonas sharmana]|uniref:Outer membrane protein assembly factor BamE n=1 Tax=Pseudaeromonas sharmana TaxID=328412 RepID=A0ABV8CM45_9GAMM
MKKITLAAALLLAFTANAHAGLLDSVAKTATALDSATGGETSTQDAVLELVKSKVKEGATKEEVKKQLGEPKVIATENGNEIWKYDANSLNANAGAAMQLASALGADTSKVQKIVALHFDGNSVKSYDVVDGTLTN